MAHDALIDEMRAKDMAVAHGAHMFWNPPTAFDKSVFDKIVSSHEGASGEPLLRFSPGNDHAVLVHPEPRPAPPPPAHPDEHRRGHAALRQGHWDARPRGHRARGRPGLPQDARPGRRGLPLPVAPRHRAQPPRPA
ncbi:hypothetical protein GTW37_13965, partial [Streptomyces sp. SID4931]|nr:hypothetical protein [Streptomyces sp. SID4931]